MNTAPNDSTLKTELLENGKVMLRQIRTELAEHKEDLLSARPLEYLDRLCLMWETSNPEFAETLGKFMKSLRESVRYQVRAVFFTGLGPTWDAMQSVYEYMRDDPRFDPVVVLIPVFRQVQQDGETKKEVTYVDYLTPMGIPFLEYNQYSLADDCPDLAFINQPYESVVPVEFWPETITKHTRLVYLPYFLPRAVMEDSPTTLCQMRVYDVAWKVIGANQQHYRYYCRHAHNGGANMIVTGLPKLDHLVNLKERDITLPSGWEFIKNKTVFLWNTRYGLNFSSLPYFHEITGWFKKHDDCALIWRPHPMTDTVTKLYFPDRYTYLQECIQTIRDMPNAVLDEEVSFDAAFFFSDAQISDFSSMMSQYLMIDKPLLWIENPMEMPTGEEFVRTQWMERTQNPAGILQFFEKIYCGIDSNRELRNKIRNQDLPLSDGHSGERICNILWEKLHLEDGIMQQEVDPI